MTTKVYVINGGPEAVRVSDPTMVKGFYTLLPDEGKMFYIWKDRPLTITENKEWTINEPKV